VKKDSSDFRENTYSKRILQQENYEKHREQSLGKRERKAPENELEHIKKQVGDKTEPELVAKLVREDRQTH